MIEPTKPLRFLSTILKDNALLTTGTDQGPRIKLWRNLRLIDSEQSDPLCGCRFQSRQQGC